MTLPIFPGRNLIAGLTYSQKWSLRSYNAPTATTATGADIDLYLSQTPLDDFELTYAFLRDGLAWGPSALATLEFRTLMGFFRQLNGTPGRFLYRNIDDWRVFQNQIGVGDGLTTTFALTRFFGANGYGLSEPVGQVDLNEPFNVYLGGAATPLSPTFAGAPAFTLNTSAPVANTITFATAPALGQSINVDMSYFYYCKLADNSNSFEKFMDRLWKIGKVTLHSCRPGT